MDIEEYGLLLKKIEDKCNQEKAELAKEFALSNNNVKIGDFVTDHMHTIKVERIFVTKLHSIPTCVYTGPRYTKAGKPTKRPESCQVYQTNIKK